MRRPPAALACLAAALACLAAASAAALDPARLPTQYAHRAWFTKDGLPQDSVQAIVQTREGFLWFGTQEGLARFDGVRFLTYHRANTPALETNYVHALREDRTGALWIGTKGGGLTRLKDGASPRTPSPTGSRTTRHRPRPRAAHRAPARRRSLGRGLAGRRRHLLLHPGRN